MSILHVGVVLGPPVVYLFGGFAQNADEAMSGSMPPEGQMFWATAFVGFFGLVFVGSIVCAILLAIRSLEKPKK